MKRLLQRMALMLVVLAFSLPSMAYDVAAGGFYFLKTGTYEYSVTFKDTNYNSYTDENINIPSIVIQRRDQVTGISNMAFRSCKKIKTINIPSTVRSVYSTAFAFCSNLETITVRSSTPPVVDEAFSALDASKIILKVPTGSIDAYKTAEGWKDFGTITDNEDLSFVADDIAYTITSATDKTVEVTFKTQDNSGNEYMGDVTVPQTVTHGGVTYTVTGVGHNAFVNCFRLNKVILPNTVTYLGEYAFPYSSVNEVTMPSSLITIGDCAFIGASNLKEIELPRSVRTIGQAAFGACRSLSKVKLNQGLTEIGYEAFSGCAFEELVIPSTVTTIGYKAFTNCNKLVNLTNKATTPQTITSEVFTGVDLSKVALCVPNSALSDYKAANVWKDFGTIAALTYQYEIDGIYYNKSTALATNLLEVASRSSLGDSYSGEVYVPGEIAENTGLSIKVWPVTGVGDRAFYESTRLTKVTLNDNLAYINQYAFGRCYNLSQVDMPAKLMKIGTGAFSNCYKLTKIKIPSGVTSIGDYAFLSCRLLKTVENHATTPQTISANAFDGVDLSQCTLLVPKASIAAYQAAPVWKDFGNIMAVDRTIYTVNGIYYKKADFGNYLIVTYKDENFNSYTGNVVIPENVRLDPKDRFFLTVVGIDEHAFDGSTGLTSVVMPETIIEIGNYAFAGCTSLTTVTNKNEKPQKINWTVFDNVELASCKLIAGNAYAYRDAYIWREFGTIEENRLGVFEEDGILYKITSVLNQTVEITYQEASKRYAGDFTVPSSVEHNGTTYKVTGVGDYTFYYCYNLTNVTLPNTITYLGSHSFSYIFLGKLIIPNSVTTIKEMAFDNAYGLKEIEIPGSVTSIGAYAFRATYMQKLKIAEGVTTIGINAFNGCNATEIEIPSTVSTIAGGAFGRNVMLKTMTNYATTPQTIVPDVFDDTDISKAELCVPQANMAAYKAADVWKDFGSFCTPYETKFEKNGIYYRVVSRADKTAEVTFKDPSFNSYSGMVNIPATVTNGGTTYNVTRVGEDAFRECSELTGVNIPVGVKSIEVRAFMGTKKLTSVTIPDGVTFIAGASFNNSTGLTDVVLPNTVEEIQVGAFEGCRNLKNINLPNSLKYLASETFYDCKSLESIELPNSLNLVSRELFYGCTSLKSVVLPNTIVALGSKAFANCKSLKHFTSNSATPPELYDGAFEGAEQKNCTLYVPEGSGDAYRAADGWKEFGTILEMTSGVDAVEATDGDVTVKTVGGEIIIAGADDAAPVAIYTVVGVQVYGGTDKAVAVSPGIYIVKVLDKAYKVKVK